MVTMTIWRNAPESFTMLEQDFRMRRALRQLAPHVSISRREELVEFGGELVMPSAIDALALQEELEHADVASYFVPIEKDL